MNPDSQTTLDLFMTPEEMLIWAIVRRRHGKAAAMLGTDIAARTGIKYKRVQEIISHLASNHQLFIASCTTGYFVPATADEHIEANKSLRHRAMVILWRVARQEERSIDEVYGQSRMEFVGSGVQGSGSRGEA
jgi:hypothetical protein